MLCLKDASHISSIWRVPSRLSTSGQVLSRASGRSSGSWGPEGTFLIVNESDGLNEGDRKWLALIDGLAIYTEEELVRFLEEAGFSEAEADRAPKKHWLCPKARK